MKIGIFDSGLGGLLIAKVIRKAILEYDYVYLGDTKRVPYGNRSYDKEAFQKQNSENSRHRYDRHCAEAF